MFKKISFILIIALSVTFCSCSKEENDFTHWKENAPAIQKLQEYIKSVTDKESPDYIPPEDRIAVFDFDGTLYCETFPIYGEWILFAEYVLKNKDKVSEEIFTLAEEIDSLQRAKDIPLNMEEAHIHAHAEAFAGLTIPEYNKLVEEYKKTEAQGFENMIRGEAFYLPMLEIVDHLVENDFIVYICSGTNRFTVRKIAEEVLPIPPRQIIGTDFTIVADGQGEEKDMHYQYTEDDELLMGDTVIIKNIKMSKVTQIQQEIGQKPVLIFGNSNGDVSMAKYAVQDNKYKTEVFFVLCDDIVRDHGNIEKADSIKEICKENNWNTISMANDWVTIYGSDVTIA